MELRKEEEHQRQEKEEAKAYKTVSLMRFAAECMGFEVSGRIWLRSRESGKEYK